MREESIIIFTYSAIVRRPTVVSGLSLTFERATTFTASCWACKRVGMKSPLRIHSLLSTLVKNQFY